MDRRVGTAGPVDGVVTVARGREPVLLAEEDLEAPLPAAPVLLLRPRLIVEAERLQGRRGKVGHEDRREKALGPARAFDLAPRDDDGPRGPA